jgi:hypothetical protein
MQLTINLNIEDAISKAINSEVMAPVIEKAVFGAVKSAIEDATGYSSEFRKNLHKQLVTTLPHGLDLNDLAKFQHILNQAMTAVVNGANNDTVSAAMTYAVKAVLPEVEPVVKVTELLELAREEFHVDPNEEFYAFYEESEYGGGYLYLDSDPKPGHSRYSLGNGDRESCKYSAKYRIAFNKEGEAYSMKLADQDLLPNKLPHAISRFDTLLLAMYVGRTRLEVDCDDGDCESKSGFQYD